MPWTGACAQRSPPALVCGRVGLDHPGRRPASRRDAERVPGVTPMPYSDPDRARGYQREYRRTRRAGDGCTTPSTTPIPLPFRLKTAADVLALLEEQVQAVRAEQEAGALEKARAIGYLA